MGYTDFRRELNAFYLNKVDSMADSFRERVFAELDAKCRPGMDGFARKTLQYEAIAEECAPILFDSSPFYHELGTIHKLGDGAGDFHGTVHAGNWNYGRSVHMFADQDRELWKLRQAQGENLLYLICGPYADIMELAATACKYDSITYILTHLRIDCTCFLPSSIVTSIVIVIFVAKENRLSVNAEKRQTSHHYFIIQQVFIY